MGKGTWLGLETDPDSEDWYRFDANAGLIQFDLAFAWPEPASVDTTHPNNVWVVNATGLGFFNFRWTDPPISETVSLFTPTTFYVSVKNIAGACPALVDTTGATIDLPLPYTINIVIP